MIDASIMPQATAGDLNAPTLMLAERAADIVLQRLLQEAGEAPLMAPKDWQERQRSPTIGRNYALDRAELCAVLSTDLNN